MQPGSPWWMRGRRSPTALGGAVEGSREPEVEVTALRRLSGTSSKRTPQIEERVNARTSTGDLLLFFCIVSASHYHRQTLGSELPVRPANPPKGLWVRTNANSARQRTPTARPRVPGLLATPLDQHLQRILEEGAARLRSSRETTHQTRIRR